VLQSAPSLKSCCHCGKDFLPRYTTTQQACSLSCAARFAKKQRLSKEKQERAQTKERKAALKRIPDLIKEAQIEFNRFVRERDAGKPCICCGRPLGTGDIGGSFDAGHYRSTGSASHLRFDERNCHAQSKACNRWGAGRAVDYRIGLIARIGLAAVEALETDNTPHKWTREELIAIRDTYRAKVKELKETA
jgi:hypothetical protein